MCTGNFKKHIGSPQGMQTSKIDTGDAQILKTSFEMASYIKNRSACRPIDLLTKDQWLQTTPCERRKQVSLKNYCAKALKYKHALTNYGKKTAWHPPKTKLSSQHRRPISNDSMIWQNGRVTVYTSLLKTCVIHNILVILGTAVRRDPTLGGSALNVKETSTREK